MIIIIYSLAFVENKQKEKRKGKKNLFSLNCTATCRKTIIINTGASSEPEWEGGVPRVVHGCVWQPALVRGLVLTSISTRSRVGRRDSRWMWSFPSQKSPRMLPKPCLYCRQSR